MLSSRVYTVGGFVLKICSYTGAIPYSWDESCRILKRCKEARQKSKYYLCAFSFWLLFTFYEAVACYRSGDFKNFNLCYIFLIAAGGLGAILLSILRWPNDAGLVWFNTFLNYSKYIDRYYTKAGYRSRRHQRLIIEILIAGSLGFCLIGVLVLFFFNIFFSSSPVLLAYLPLNYMPKPRFLCVILVILCHIYHNISAFNVYMNLLLLQVFCIVGAVIVVPFGLNEFNVKKESYKTVPSLRRPKRLCLAYREMQLFVGTINSVLGNLLVPGQTLVMQLAMVAAFLISKHGKTMGETMQLVVMTWTMAGTVTWLAALELCGYIHWNGLKVLESWKYHNWATRRDKSLMSKFRRSAKPIMICYGQTFIIKRANVLKFSRGLVKGIFRTLLTLGKE